MTTVGEPLVAPLPAATAVGVVRPALRLRELALVVAGGIALAIGLTWPVAAHLGTNIAGDLGDPVRTNLARAGLPPSVRNAPLPADPAAAAAEPIRGLLLRRRSLPGAVVYSVLHVPGGRAS